jgi:hypothetical protein
MMFYVSAKQNNSKYSEVFAAYESEIERLTLVRIGTAHLEAYESIDLSHGFWW